MLRVWNNELDENPEGVFRLIVDRAAECLGGTHPTPPFQGGEKAAPPLRLIPPPWKGGARVREALLILRHHFVSAEAAD